MAKVALLIGVSEYESPHLKALPAATQDVEAMQRVLQDQEIGGFDVKTLINPEPVAMQEAIETLFSNRQKDDLVLLYFSGHGIKDDGGRLYFATRITRQNQLGELIKASTVSADSVHDIINDSRSRSKRQVIILDCCFSGAFAKDRKGEDEVFLDFQKIQLGGEGRVVLTSSSSTQYSFESIYTQYLVHGIETGEADENNDGFISVDELHQYVQRKVQENNTEMKPQIQAVIKEGYNIVLAKAPIHNRETIYLGIVKYWVRNGQISKIGRLALNEQQNRLEIEPDKASALEEEGLKPYKEYQRKLKQYKEAFLQAIQQENPIIEQTRNELILFQRLLQLTDEDIALIEAPIIANLQNTKKKDKFITLTVKEKFPQSIVLVVVAILCFGTGIISSFFIGKLSKYFSINTEPCQNNVQNNGMQNTLTKELEISYGGQILKPGDTNSCKKAGTQAFASGNYDEALRHFKLSIEKSNSNDPEALIYLNNTKARQKGDKLKIAVSIPIGTNLGSAEEIMRGVAQVQNEVNSSGGINGKLLQVAIANDYENSYTATKIAKSLVQDQEVLGVVGHISSDVTKEAGRVYNSGELVAISPTSTSVKISNFSPYIFRTVPSDTFAAEALAKYMVTTLQKRKAAVFFNFGNAYSESLKQEFISAVEKKGGQVLKEPEFDLSKDNFNAATAVEQAIRQGAQILMLVPDSITMDKAQKVVQENQQRSRLNVLGGDNVYSKNTLETWGKQAEGMVVAIPWNINSKPNSSFVHNSKSLWKAPVNWRTATSYDATKAIIAALKINTTRKGLQQTLHDPSFSVDGATGKIQFLQSGDRKDNTIFLVKIQQIPGTDKYEFVPIQP
ncbi:MAG: ABC transporter substrate-binding protein [Nostoc sp. JL34]|uniref:caspase, EACC1-associated type n=1 Tax=unclassified Nostoc TaxID=2593658 RepID=UPI001DD8D5B8|nr:ABC transporter substrate-binding protein [Nostoc sp. JL34]MBN3882787.1 ABC transporter substrate-binding protein [Nostoc sp. JL34]